MGRDCTVKYPRSIRNSVIETVRLKIGDYVSQQSIEVIVDAMLEAGFAIAYQDELETRYADLVVINQNDLAECCVALVVGAKSTNPSWRGLSDKLCLDLTHTQRVEARRQLQKIEQDAPGSVPA